MAGNVKQGLTAGLIVALFASASVGGSSGSFWLFLVTLTFSMLCVGATHWFLVAVRARDGETDH